MIPLLVAALLAATLTMSPATTPSSPSTGDARSPEEILANAGKRNIGMHDPSTIVKEGDTYWVFSTGVGVNSFHSRDLIHWERGPRVFPELPEWITDVAPGQRGHFWAPDIIEHNGRFLLYYSVSAFGRNTSAIALATSPTLDPEHPDYGWKDEGIVIRSQPGDHYNAIDPAVLRDQEGRLWMSFGSFWSGLKLIELDPTTGKRTAPDAPIHHIAAKELGGVNEIEAPAIYFHDGYYYLFVNWDICCRGVESTYNIRVGRSREITGPYVDKDGRDLANGGGSLFLATDGPFIGPGHVGIFEEDGQHWLSVHFYDATANGRPTLALRPLAWDDDGWPTLPATPE